MVTENTLRVVLLNMIILRENEKILRVVRRHRSTLTGAFGLPLLALALVIVVRSSFKFNFFGYPWQVIGALAGLSVIYISAKTLIWRRNALIITNQRIVHYSQTGLFKARMREIGYEDIADLVVQKKGLAALVGDRGALMLTTTARQRIAMDDIASPDAVVELINKMRRSSAGTKSDVTAP
jgi:hypothetical protein